MSSPSFNSPETRLTRCITWLYRSTAMNSSTCTDPVWQTLHPPGGEGYGYVHPPEKQPYIGWVVRLGCYAQLQGKSLEYVNQVSSLIFGDHVAHWPAHVKKHFNRIEGLDYDTAVKYMQNNIEEIDSC